MAETLNRLDYGNREATGKNWPHPILIALLTFPGLICWVTLLSGTWLNPFRQASFPLEIGLICWPIAFICALFSLAFIKHWRCWYVLICLIVNISGLGFTFLLFFGSRLFF